MIFQPTELQGVVVVEPEPSTDERGSFARVFDAAEFGRRGLLDRIVQSSLSVNRRAGTLRGLHLQRDPYGEAKLIRCPRGAIFDVAVDLRPSSPTFGRWFGTELNEENHRALHVPEGCAHGFQTLVDNTEVAYDISVAYVLEAAAGVAWDDPRLAVDWPPADARILSERDAALPTLDAFLAES